jgi:hypothetical protein
MTESFDILVIGARNEYQSLSSFTTLPLAESSLISNLYNAFECISGLYRIHGDYIFWIIVGDVGQVSKFTLNDNIVYENFNYDGRNI